MRARTMTLALGAAVAAAGCRGATAWPQAAGPAGTWKLDVPDPPTRWSVARGDNILWRTTLPNGGQGGIAVWGDRLFVTTFGEAPPDGKKHSNLVLGHALDRKTGRILWSVSLVGSRPSPMMYAFSDATSWTPVTDGQHVWFFNSSGAMGCWDLNGRELWRRTFRGQPDKYPFNRQLEPILFEGTLVTVEPLLPGEPGYRADRDDWHYLRGIDKLTGKTAWIAEDATTFYNTPVMGRLADGRSAILHGRGGPHDVPERPIGLSMTSLVRGQEGKTIWRFEPREVPGGPVDGTTYQALYTMVWDQRYAYWWKHAPEESHLVLDASTGRLLREQSLIRKVDVRMWRSDGERKGYVLHAGANIRELGDAPAYALKPGEVMHVFPAWHSNMVVGGHHYFLASTNHHRNGHAPKGHAGPSHSLGRIDVETGKVEYLELPVGVDRKAGAPDEPVYGRSLRTRPEDSRGQDMAAEDRSRTDGWEIAAFFPSPIVLGDRLYISALLGVTYVIDTRAPVLDERALISVNDLGPLGATWSLSGPSYAGGVLFHRSLKELVAIGSR